MATSVPSMNKWLRLLPLGPAAVFKSTNSVPHR
jgi:hypothetical protein